MKSKAQIRVTAGGIALGLAFALKSHSALCAAPAAAPGTPPAAATAADAPVDDAALATIVDLNKKAIVSYRAGKFDAAATDLTSAVKLADEHGFANHEVMARTQIHLGVVAITGLKDRNRGLEAFARALAVNPNIKVTPSLSTPALRHDLRVARKVKLPPKPNAAAAGDANGAQANTGDAKNKEATGPVAKQAAGNDNEPPLPKAPPQPLYCPTPDVGPPGEAVPLFCVARAEVSSQKVLAFFRPAGAETYTTVAMEPSASGWRLATIPAKDVKGRSIQVYFEARDNADHVLASNGKDELPNVIQLKSGAPHISPKKLALLEVGDPPPADGDEATPLELRNRAAELAAEEGPPKDSFRRASGRLWFGFGAGSGYGWHGALPLERHFGRQVTTGFSPAGLGHVSFELGYQLTPRLSLSLQTRHQYLPPTGSGDAEVTRAAPDMAHAILLHAQYDLYDLGNLQLLATLSGGGGSAMRMQVAPDRASGLASSDTVVAGRGVLGPGIGLAYNFSPRFVAAVETRALAGIPQFGMMLEATANMQYAF